LPSESVVLICPWIVHHDARWFPDPGRFDPDRWCEDSSNSSRPRWSYFPFGGGSRSCIGESFAWMEAVIVLATVARNWRVVAVAPRHPALVPTITLRPKGPLPVRVEARPPILLDRC
jgi:cytochrome P450